MAEMEVAFCPYFPSRNSEIVLLNFKGKVIQNFEFFRPVMVRLDRTIQKPLQRLKKNSFITPGWAFWILRSSRSMTSFAAARKFSQTPHHIHDQYSA
jgi:hypothetical protein